MDENKAALFSWVVALFITAGILYVYDCNINILESKASAQSQDTDYRSMRALEGIRDELQQLRRNCR
jgi:hypothetical protein